MADKKRHTLTKPDLRALLPPILRALLPPITPGFVLRAILGAILFFCGIVYGMWLIFRFRRRGEDRPA